MNTAYIYARVSTEEQAQEGKSIEIQEKICRKWATDNDYATLGVYKDEGKSATSLKNRPALKKYLQDVRKTTISRQYSFRILIDWHVIPMTT